jgi:hypothetical protein
MQQSAITAEKTIRPEDSSRQIEDIGLNLHIISFLLQFLQIIERRCRFEFIVDLIVFTSAPQPSFAWLHLITQFNSPTTKVP